MPRKTPSTIIDLTITNQAENSGQLAAALSLGSLLWNLQDHSLYPDSPIPTVLFGLQGTFKKLVLARLEQCAKISCDQRAVRWFRQKISSMPS